MRSVDAEPAAHRDPRRPPRALADSEGQTNKQIAQALFVTLRTVEMHLSNSYRKLGIENRSQLAAALTSV
ncbi:MAG: helix-turn-helix transcriptional regulator [Actinomycetota bacterium]|nr:helix-turn-helix transcriptional regulator [Actinomycetota bacterium]